MKVRGAWVVFLDDDLRLGGGRADETAHVISHVWDGDHDLTLLPSEPAIDRIPPADLASAPFPRTVEEQADRGR